MPEVFPDRLSMVMTARANSAPWSCRTVLITAKFLAKVQRGRQGRVGDDESLHGGLRPPFRDFFKLSRQLQRPRCSTRACVHAQSSACARGNQTWLGSQARETADGRENGATRGVETTVLCVQVPTHRNGGGARHRRATSDESEAYTARVNQAPRLQGRASSSQSPPPRGTH